MQASSSSKQNEGCMGKPWSHFNSQFPSHLMKNSFFTLLGVMYCVFSITIVCKNQGSSNSSLPSWVYEKNKEWYRTQHWMKLWRVSNHLLAQSDKFYNFRSYCWWKKPWALQCFWNLVDNAINYQPQLVSLPHFFHQRHWNWTPWKCSGETSFKPRHLGMKRQCASMKRRFWSRKKTKKRPAVTWVVELC